MAMVAAMALVMMLTEMVIVDAGSVDISNCEDG